MQKSKYNCCCLWSYENHCISIKCWYFKLCIDSVEFDCFWRISYPEVSFRNWFQWFKQIPIFKTFIWQNKLKLTVILSFCVRRTQYVLTIRLDCDCVCFNIQNISWKRIIVETIIFGVPGLKIHLLYSSCSFRLPYLFIDEMEDLIQYYCTNLPSNNQQVIERIYTPEIHTIRFWMNQ